MLTIVRVGMLDGNTLDVQFSNNNILLLELTPLMQRPEFSQLIEDDRILYPKTDGQSVYWRDGPGLTLEDIIAMVRS
ncbi:MAG: hypothetical protein FWE59_05840 [Oscillospiraceae bacterium]|nr:hypothetical protein [Oscillospiraceae bacterium]